MKIVALMIIKDESDIIASTLENASAWVDEIYAIDNGSTDGSLEILQASSLVKSVIVDTTEFDESYFIGRLLDLAKDSNADWFVDLDADEHYDPAIRHVLENCLVSYNTVSVTIRYMVGHRCYREHREWVRIYRNDPSLFSINHVRKLHGGKIPIAKSMRSVHHSHVNVQHYQIRSYEQGMRKYENYMSLDPQLKYQSSYDHLRDLAKMIRYGDFTGLEFLKDRSEDK